MQIQIDQDICTRCGICVRDFSCPSFMQNPDGKIEINRELCNSNGSCTQVCPEKAIMRVYTTGERNIDE